MQRIAAAAITPPATSRRRLAEEIAAHAIPESNAKPKAGVYKNLSAISNAMGMIQLETGSNVMKKNRMPSVIAGRFLMRIAAARMQAKTSPNPAQASQSLKPATGMELKS